jgi:hypothetical protein
MYRSFTVFAASIVSLVVGCSSPEPAAPEASAPAQTAPAQPNYDIPMRNFSPLQIGPYAVQPMFEEEIEDGHFNIKITEDNVTAVRIWVGGEDPGDVMVVKTEIENDYHHGHVEIPNPIPAGAALWIEIETPEGELLKGSTPLSPAE